MTWVATLAAIVAAGPVVVVGRLASATVDTASHQAMPPRDTAAGAVTAIAPALEVVATGPAWLDARSVAIALLALLLVLALCGAGWLFLALRRQQLGARAVREAERLRYGRALEGARDGLAIWDPEGRLLTWNRRFADIAALLGRAPRAEQTMQEFLAGTPWVADPAGRTGTDVAPPPHTVELPDGVVVEIAHRRDANGDSITTLRDVSAERAAQRLAAASEARFRDGIENMAEGFMLWDGEDRLVAWNRQAEILLPVQAPLFRVGLNFAEVLAHLARFNGGHAQRETWLAELEMRRRRRERLGQVSTFRSSLDRLVESVDRATSDGGIVSTYRDVTDQRRLLERLHAGEIDLRRALTAEREMNEQQRRFVAMASHEFRTPLAIIDGAAQRLQAMAGVVAVDAAKRIARIRAAVSRMTEIIDRTLATARLDQGRIEAKRQRCDVLALAQEVVRRQQTITPDYAIAVSGGAAPAVIDADMMLLDHILTNLVSNAVKYSRPEAAIDLRIDPGPDDVVIEITDRGIGIPEDELGQVFSRFFRSRLVSGIAGTGIGLYLVREFVAMHGGTIAVRSEVDRGTTFTVRLPRREALAAVA
ncbi:MAG: PAS-domain containing protein [Alphaproteobacteria bacterium]|nr:PAS-domain containing protein [Alphaproteobacteria bacterium]